MNRCRVVVTLMLALHAAGAAQNEHTAFQYYQEGSRSFVDQRFDRAIEALKKSIALDPKQVGAVRLLGLTYVLTGQLNDAESQFKDACRLAPKEAEGWFYLGRVRRPARPVPEPMYSTAPRIPNFGSMRFGLKLAIRSPAS